MKARVAMAAACMALAIPTIALAVENTREAPHPPHPAPGAAQLTSADLGGLLSVVEFCEDVTPNQRKQLHENAKQLMSGLSEDRIEAMKRSSDFKTSHDTISGILKEIPKDQAILVCGQFERAA